MAAERPQESAQPLPVELKTLLRAHQEWLCGILDLVGVETRRAGLSMALILGLVGLLLLAVSGVWILACATAVAAAVASGATWTAGLLTVTLLNVLLVGAILLVIKRLSRNLDFAASRAALRPPPESGSSRPPGEVYRDAEAA